MTKDEIGVLVYANQSLKELLKSGSKSTLINGEPFVTDDGTPIVDVIDNMIKKYRPNHIGDRYVIVTENDMDGDRWMESRGPICHEAYVGESTLNKVLEKSKYIGTRYGRQMICRLEPMGTPEEFERLMEEEL